MRRTLEPGKESHGSQGKGRITAGRQHSGHSLLPTTLRWGLGNPGKGGAVRFGAVQADLTFWKGFWVEMKVMLSLSREWGGKTQDLNTIRLESTCRQEQRPGNPGQPRAPTLLRRIRGCRVLCEYNITQSQDSRGKEIWQQLFFFY